MAETRTKKRASFQELTIWLACISRKDLLLEVIRDDDRIDLDELGFDPDGEGNQIISHIRQRLNDDQDLYNSVQKTINLFREYVDSEYSGSECPSFAQLAIFSQLPDFKLIHRIEH